MLSKSEILMIGVAAAIAAVVVFIALLVRVRRRGTRTEVDSCHQCGSMNVQNRAGLVVCVDCGYSVKTAEAEA